MTDQLFVNGKVFTGRGEDDFVTAFRVTDGTFSWVGSQADLDLAEQAAGIDLRGRTVIPGLLDVHTHPAFLATLVDTISCLPPEVKTLAGLLDRLRTHPNLGAGPHQWVQGFGYDESKYPEGRGPTAADLDQVSSTQPVFVQRCDGHSSVANHRALELAGITQHTPDPAGGSLGRDDAGRLNGLLIETAATDIVAVADLLATMVPHPLRTFRAAESAGLQVQCALYYGCLLYTSPSPRD